MRSDFSFGFAVGFVGGAATTIFVSIALLVAPNLDGLFGSLERWQTLISGGLAVVAGSASVYFLRRQIAQTATLADVERSRKLSAARATLPLVLSQICDYAEGSCQYVMDGTVRPDLPPVSGALADCVHHGESTLQIGVSQLLAHLQIQWARMIDFRPANTNPETTAALILDAVELYVRASNMFDYARAEAEEIRLAITSADMRSAANILGFRGADSTEIHAAIARRY